MQMTALWRPSVCACWGLLPVQHRRDLLWETHSFSQQDQREGEFARRVSQMTRDHVQVAGGGSATHGRDRAGRALVLEQPLAGGEAPAVPLLLVSLPLAAFPMGEPPGSPSTVVCGMRLSCPCFVQDLPGKWHQERLLLHLQGSESTSAVRNPVGTEWEHAFMLLPSRESSA